MCRNDPTGSRPTEYRHPAAGRESRPFRGRRQVGRDCPDLSTARRSDRGASGGRRVFAVLRARGDPGSVAPSALHHRRHRCRSQNASRRSCQTRRVAQSREIDRVLFGRGKIPLSRRNETRLIDQGVTPPGGYHRLPDNLCRIAPGVSPGRATARPQNKTRTLRRFGVRRTVRCRDTVPRRHPNLPREDSNGSGISVPADASVCQVPTLVHASCHSPLMESVPLGDARDLEQSRQGTSNSNRVPTWHVAHRPGKAFQSAAVAAIPVQWAGASNWISQVRSDSIVRSSRCGEA